MTLFQGDDEISSRWWTGLVRRPKSRTALWITLGCLGSFANLALGWWLVTDAWPDHQIRQETRALRDVALPEGFELAPNACPGAIVLCAWTDLEPAEASARIGEALAATGFEVPESRCGRGTRIPNPGWDVTLAATADGVCAALDERHGLLLGILARDEVPFVASGYRELQLPRTLVTAGWYYSPYDRTVPGTPSLGDQTVLISPEEVAALPGGLASEPCPHDCITPSFALTTEGSVEETYWAMAERLLAEGTVADWINCGPGEEWCSLEFSTTRPAQPGESLRIYLDTTSGGVEVGVVPWT